MNFPIMSISPMGFVLGMLIIIAVNYLISFGKSKVVRNCYIAFSSLIALAGILAVFILKYTLIQRANSPRVDASLVMGSLRRFDAFYQASIAVITVMVIFLLCLLFLYKKNRNRIVMDIYSITIIIAIILNFSMGILFSIETINKFIDVPSYVLALTISEISIFHIPLAAKRILIRYQDK